MTNTGQSCLSGPAEVINYIGDSLLSLIENVEGTDMSDSSFPCEERYMLPSFYLLYGDYWFEVMPEDYTVATDEDLDECAFCL